MRKTSFPAVNLGFLAPMPDYDGEFYLALRFWANSVRNLCGERFRIHSPSEQWLSDLDSNQDKSLQRALCYHYTIGQARW